MRSNLRQAAIFLAATLTLSGCWISDEPLGPSAAAKIDARVGGAWLGKGDSNRGGLLMIAYVPRTRGFLFAWRGLDKKTGKYNTDTYNGWVTTFNGVDFMNLRPINDPRKGKYLVVPYAVVGDRLLIDFGGQGRRVRSRAELQHYIKAAQDAQRLFLKPLEFGRFGAQGALDDPAASSAPGHGPLIE